MADEAKAQPGLGCHDDEDLQNWASFENEGEVPVLHYIEIEAELPEVGEGGGARDGGGVREPPDAKV